MGNTFNTQTRSEQQQQQKYTPTHSPSSSVVALTASLYGPTPALFSALTWNLYSVNGDNPLMLCEVRDEETFAVFTTLPLLLLFITIILYRTSIPLCVLVGGGCHDNSTIFDDTTRVVTFTGEDSGAMGGAKGVGHLVTMVKQST